MYVFTQLQPPDNPSTLKTQSSVNYGVLPLSTPRRRLCCLMKQEECRTDRPFLQGEKDQINKETLEIAQADETVFNSLQELGDELPPHSPRYVLLSYPLTLVSQFSPISLSFTPPSPSPCAHRRSCALSGVLLQLSCSLTPNHTTSGFAPAFWPTFRAIRPSLLSTRDVQCGTAHAVRGREGVDAEYC